jgi:hypothetical protein
VALAVAVPALWIAVLVAGPVLGLVLRRWFVLLVPLVAVPLYFVGLNHRWWGINGTGDSWQVVAVIATLVDMAATAASIAVGRAVGRARHAR